MNASPCLGCRRVKDPQDCENKECMAWRKWYIEKWNALRREPRLKMEQPPVPEGMVIGGVRYALPHRVRSYLDRDPCGNCLCPKDLCKPPCRVKREWLQARENVML